MKTADHPAPSAENVPPRSSARDWYETLLQVAFFALFLRTFVVQLYQVPTGSMEKTILVGDHLLINQFAYAPRLPVLAKWLPYRDVRRGEIIVFKKPRGEDAGIVLVKRAVAGPGDWVKIRDKTLTVNGQPADGPQAQHIDPRTYRAGSWAAETGQPRDQFGPFRVPANGFFGMGDNRDVSLDSRFWGSIPRENIFGKPFLLYWSYEAEPNAHLWRGPVAKARQLAGVAIHFFSRTRWHRMFTTVR